MTKSLRPGKILVDWSQNNPAKTTVAPYSLRARPEPTVSTPSPGTRWQRAASCRFTAAEVLERVQRTGDLFARTLDDRLRRRITRSMATAVSRLRRL